MKGYRKEKVIALLKREISVLINENLSESIGIVSLTDIDITSDFKEAKVYISVIDEAKEKEVLKSLEEKAKEFQRVLGRKLSMKFTPRLSFAIDRFQEKVNKVDELLKEIDENGS